MSAGSRRGAARKRGFLALVLLAPACLLLGACARNSLGTASTACFKALPAAEAAVGHQGRYLGALQVSGSRFAQRHPGFAAIGNETLCLVAFQGSYGPGSVHGAPPESSGTYAIVAVDAKTGVEEAAFITRHLPVRFAHLI